VNPSVVAIIPVRALEGAKSRLGDVLDAEERRDLVVELLERTIRAAGATPGIDEVVVISPDPAALVLAADAGARPLRQAGSGLNGALDEARADAIARGVGALLVLPGDLPRITPHALAELVAAAAGSTPVVVVAPDRHGRGTNALLLAPPDAVGFAFGGDSRTAHAALARAAGARYVEVEGPLSLDVDTAEDLLIAEREPATPIR
jgi:2-phospho-L-lactate guanylyltransferase